MNTKKKKVCAIMGVVFGVGCYVSVQAGGPGKSMPKKPVKQNVRRSRSGQQQLLTAALEQAQSQKMKELVQGIRRPSQEVIITSMLEDLSNKVKDGIEVNTDTVNKMFTPGEQLGQLEREGGTNFFNNVGELYDAAIKQANEKGKIREADVLSVRRSALRKKQAMLSSDVNALLKEQRYDRLLLFSQRLNGDLEQLNSNDKGNDELIKIRQNVDARVDADLEKIKKEDKQFDKNKMFNEVLALAQKGKISPQTIVYLTERLNRKS